MLKKGSKLYSILTGTCPRCHNDKMYINSNPYNIAQTMKMHDNCRHCGLKYKIEPNFFFGSMYVSYGLGVAACVVLFAITYAFVGLEIEVAFLVILIGLLLLMPPITRLARNIYINIFINYDRSMDKKPRT
ncbi:MAG: DUF983 domain-containing protein [Flavobacterium sp.]|nr:DUF983 domain-containing protein [Flavobacterium sp.]